MPMFEMVLLYLILFLKSDKDPIQGVNKLDNLLKVSKYQRYKYTRINSTSTSVGISRM